MTDIPFRQSTTDTVTISEGGQPNRILNDFVQDALCFRLSLSYATVILLYSAILSRALPLNEGKFFWRVSFNSCVLSVLWNWNTKAFAVSNKCSFNTALFAVELQTPHCTTIAAYIKTICCHFGIFGSVLKEHSTILKSLTCHIYHSFLITTVPISVDQAMTDLVLYVFRH